MSDIDRKIDEILSWHSACRDEIVTASQGYSDPKYAEEQYEKITNRHRSEAKQRLFALMIEVRADEIATILLEHANRTTCIYVNGKRQTIESRYAELRTKLAEWLKESV